ncbi:helix-turn-helix transcriptional regulator [Pantoea sp. B65]|uniref:helix-turn-helix transcriptional regulator n=1 Tax=Pantoea sp. B65 TaxID=2813359 RepID=UPI0039B51EC1
MYSNHESDSDGIINAKMLIRSLDMLPDPYCIRTPDGRFLYANLALSRLAGLRSTDILLERLDFEIPSRLFENEETLKAWRNQDRAIIENRKPLLMLEIHPHAVESPYLCKKVPFYNNNSECIGAFCSIQALEAFTPNDFINGKLPVSLLLNKPDNFFTEKECEIIFFKLQGMSSKQIGNLTGLSHRTVENRLAQMYAKARVKHFDDFRQFCETRNLHRYLPKRLFPSSESGSSEYPEKQLPCE